ncbi:TRAP transporter small permease [Salipiger marinus]|uniref:TRAP transporter small permease protein n=1 Tax=Salipiger marinus TaxID=555512 RepID=A0A1G8PHX4_9RHOB|nr:TRAP transporter small permease [Salipiger marinus]SDI92037.1 TRAP-type C4-dicarboxylate transport system, small permease component [Salipiger marinus]
MGGAGLWLDRLARGAALAAGAVLCAMALAVTLSVVLRALGQGGLRGDYELVEMGCACAAGLVLPLCQLRRGHVVITVFTAGAPPRASAALDRIWLWLAAAIWALLWLVMLRGMAEMRGTGGRSMLLALPLWWGHLPALLGAAGAGAIALWQAVQPPPAPGG